VDGRRRQPAAISGGALLEPLTQAPMLADHRVVGWVTWRRPQR
jgi:hypothetical protein